MGTLCKNCPLKNIHKDSGEDCTIVFVRKYKNSCVTYDLAEHQFEQELNKMREETKPTAAKKPKAPRISKGSKAKKEVK